MKKTIFSVAIATVIAASSFTSCNTPEEKVTNAETKVENAKQNLEEDVKDTALAAQKEANADEWMMFKNSANATIENNEIKIRDLKSKIKKNDSKTDIVYIQKVNSLEQQNQNLKVKINNYDKNPSQWQSFKIEFNSDVEGLAKAFKDLSINNKK